MHRHSPKHQPPKSNVEQGTVVQGDLYVSAMPVDLIKKLIPTRMKERWSYFDQLDELEGVPVINIHLWCVSRAGSARESCPPHVRV